MYFVVGVAMLVAAYVCLDLGRTWINSPKRGNRPANNFVDDLIAIVITSLTGFGVVALFSGLLLDFNLVRAVEFVAAVAALFGSVWLYNRFVHHAPPPVPGRLPGQA